MNSIVRNGRPIAFGVGERVCPPQTCPCDVGIGAISAAVHPPDVKLSIRVAENAARASAAHPGMTPAQVYELARRNAEVAVARGSAGRRGVAVAPPRHPAVAAAIRTAAHEAVLAHAWRPEWGSRPAGFGATQWRPEWGRRPAWFGARRWRSQWGDQPAWWAAQQAAVATPQPSPADGAASASDATPAATDSAATDSPAATPGDAAPAAASGLSTPAKIGIGVVAVAVVGGTVAAIATHGKKRAKTTSASSSG